MEIKAMLSTEITKSIGINYEPNLITKYDVALKVASFIMAPQSRPSYTTRLLHELKNAQQFVLSENFKYIILSSAIDGVFNLGGDLELFIHLVENKDRDGLEEYMKLCLAVLHPDQLINSDLHRIAVVQGAALGGGFESALCCDFIIAEERAFFGFPEVLFNLFPGMGAYSYLVRRTTPSFAKKLLTSGIRYSAREMLDMGVIDMVVADGKGHKAAENYIHQHKKLKNSYDAINTLQNIVFPLEYRELLQIGYRWVDAAMKLNGRDLRLMEKLGKNQNKFS